MKHALIAIAFLALAGCPKPRTSAMTQPTPAAFDASQSDAKALETVDAGMTALGGYDKWTNLKELSFTYKISQNGEVKEITMHRWDRWNGRHNFQSIDMSTTKSGKPDDIKSSEVRYDIFDASKKPFATYDGKEIMRADADKAAAQARQRLAEEGYLITLLYRARDPGVKLKDGGDIKVEGICDPCKQVQITFDPAVGKDTWFIDYDPTKKLPKIIEVKKPQGLIAYTIDGWADAGGLKWPTKLENIGAKKGGMSEIAEFSDIAVGEPEDNTYMRSVNE
jgi:hypothetical protein